MTSPQETSSQSGPAVEQGPLLCEHTSSPTASSESSQATPSHQGTFDTQQTSSTLRQQTSSESQDESPSCLTLPQNSTVQNPHRESQSQTPHQEIESQSPRQAIQSHSTHQEIQAQSPHQEIQSQSPHHEIQSQSPHQETQSQSPHHEIQSQSPHQETQSQSPHHEIQSQSPHLEIQSQSPHQETQSQSPHQEIQSQSPHQETESQSPHHEIQSQSPHGEIQSQSPHRESQLPSQLNSNSPVESRNRRHKNAAFVMVGLVFMLTSAAHWTNTSVVNRYTHLNTLRGLVSNSSGHSSHGDLNSSDVDQNLGVLCQPNATSSEQRLLDQAQEITSNFLLFFSLCKQLPAVFTIIVLGAHSDVIGRRLLFALPVVGLLLGNAVTSMVLGLNADPRWFFLGSFAEGVFGGFGAVKLACYTYAVDIAKSGGKKTRALARVQTMMGVAGIAMHVLIGYCVQTFWLFYPAVASTVPPLVTLLLVVFCLREMVDVRTVRTQEGSSGRPLWSWVSGVVKRVKQFYVQPNASPNTRFRFRLGVAAFSFLVLPNKARFRLLFMYEVNSPLCWSPLVMGGYRSFSDGCQHALGYVFILALQRFALDETLGIVGLLSLVLADVGVAFSDSTRMMFGASALGLAGAMPNPILRSLMSQLVSPHRQGTMFANLAVFESILGLLGQTLYFMYRNIVESMRGAVFLVMASSRVVSILFVIGLKIKSRGQHCQTDAEILIGETTAHTDQPESLNSEQTSKKHNEQYNQSEAATQAFINT